MQLEVNGQTRPLPARLTIAQLLDDLKVNARQVAVEVNCELIPRTDHSDHQLNDGDRVEIATLVGGG